MKCPNCEANNNRVTWGTNTKQGSHRRYRRCLSCGTIFKSLECYMPAEQIEMKIKHASNKPYKLTYYNDDKGKLRVKEVII